MVPSANHVAKVGHGGVMWLGWIFVLDKRALELQVLILGAFFLDQIRVSRLKVLHLHLTKWGKHGDDIIIALILMVKSFSFNFLIICLQTNRKQMYDVNQISLVLIIIDIK